MSCVNVRRLFYSHASLPCPPSDESCSSRTTTPLTSFPCATTSSPSVLMASPDGFASSSRTELPRLLVASPTCPTPTTLPTTCFEGSAPPARKHLQRDTTRCPRRRRARERVIPMPWSCPRTMSDEETKRESEKPSGWWRLDHDWNSSLSRSSRVWWVARRARGRQCSMSLVRFRRGLLHISRLTSSPQVEIRGQCFAKVPRGETEGEGG